MLRPVSWRAHLEQRRIERWLEAVARAAGWDERLACEVAQLARLVKGYGDVRRRLVALFDTGLALALSAGEAESRLRAGFAVSTALTERFRTLVLEGPEGETRAAALAADASARLAAGDFQGVQALVARTTVS
jgi:hypothetical protein